MQYRIFKNIVGLVLKNAQLTINVSVVCMARDFMTLMRANPLKKPLEAVGPENRDFLEP
jgi:hypothetical protein